MEPHDRLLLRPAVAVPALLAALVAVIELAKVGVAS